LCNVGGAAREVIGDDEGSPGCDDEGPCGWINNTTDARMMRGSTALSSEERKDLCAKI